MEKIFKGTVGVIVAIFFLGCAGSPKTPDPAKIAFAEPKPQGKYALPYKADGTLAGWVERAKEAKKKYSTVDTGKQVAHGLAKHFLGSGLAKVATDTATSAAAEAAKAKILKDVVGEFDTDQYLDDECDYSLYLFGKYSKEKNYKELLDLVFFVYKPIAEKYQKCLEKYVKDHPESAKK